MNDREPNDWKLIYESLVTLPRSIDKQVVREGEFENQESGINQAAKPELRDIRGPLVPGLVPMGESLVGDKALH